MHEIGGRENRCKVFERHAHMQSLFDPAEQVRPREAVETQIPLELRVEFHGVWVGRVPVGFGVYHGNNPENLRGKRCIGECFIGFHHDLGPDGMPTIRH